MRPLRRRPGAASVIAVLVAFGIGSAVWTLLSPDRMSPSALRPLAGLPAVAVLPFENLGADAEQDYFANGITADLITDLSRIEALLVIAPGSVFAYEGGITGARQIATEMQLDYVVVGRVQRLQDRLRINVRTDRGQRRARLVGARFSGSMTDLFDVQDRITSDVISALKVKLLYSEQRCSPTDRLPMWSPMIVTCVAFRITGSRTALQNLSARSFRRAIELDPRSRAPTRAWP